MLFLLTISSSNIVSFVQVLEKTLQKRTLKVNYLERTPNKKRRRRKETRMSTSMSVRAGNESDLPRRHRLVHVPRLPEDGRIRMRE